MPPFRSPDFIRLRAEAATVPVSDCDNSARLLHEPASTATWSIRIALRMSPCAASAISSISSFEHEKTAPCCSRSRIPASCAMRTSSATGAKKSGRHRELIAGMIALWFVVEKIKRQVPLVLLHDPAQPLLDLAGQGVRILKDHES